jgi:predicted DNA-binding transcriptional regulator AlpA
MESTTIPSSKILDMVTQEEIVKYVEQKYGNLPSFNRALDVPETCEFLGGISRMSLYRQMKARKITGIRIGSRLIQVGSGTGKMGGFW